MAAEWKQTGLFKGTGLPVPSGQHRVGCVDVMPLCPGEESGLLFRLYYPTEATPDSGYHYAPWLPNRLYARGYLLFKRYSSVVAGALGYLINSFCEQNIAALYGEPVKTSAPLPVIMFSHGSGGMRTNYSAICCDLASHGYLVTAIEHRDHSAAYCYLKQRRQDSQEYVDEWIPFERPSMPFHEAHPFRAKQLVLRRKEIKLGIDFIYCLNETSEFKSLLQSDFDFGQFKGKLDLEHIAMMGHSFGAATTVTALADDKRFKVGVALDAYLMPVEDGIESGVEQPLLFINSWTFQWPENVAKIKSLVDTSAHSDIFSPSANNNSQQRQRLSSHDGSFQRPIYPVVYPTNQGQLGRFLSMAPHYSPVYDPNTDYFDDKSKHPTSISEGINEEICIQANLQRRQQQQDEFESAGLAYDPYLICHKCNRQFREGQLPEYRHHIDNCHH